MLLGCRRHRALRCRLAIARGPVPRLARRRMARRPRRCRHYAAESCRPNHGMAAARRDWIGDPLLHAGPDDLSLVARDMLSRVPLQRPAGAENKSLTIRPGELSSISIRAP